jgi:hypothetical protein
MRKLDLYLMRRLMRSTGPSESTTDVGEESGVRRPCGSSTPASFRMGEAWERCVRDPNVVRPE